MDGRTDSPCVLQDFVPFGAAAQKRIVEVGGTGARTTMEIEIVTFRIAAQEMGVGWLGGSSLVCGSALTDFERMGDGQTDGRTDIPSYRDARTHLKMRCKEIN